jgi:hypothetical protein
MAVFILKTYIAAMESTPAVQIYFIAILWKDAHIVCDVSVSKISNFVSSTKNTPKKNGLKWQIKSLKKWKLTEVYESSSHDG